MITETSKNILGGTKTYLAGNLEFSKDASNWRDLIELQLSQINITCLSPIKVTFENQKEESEQDREGLKAMRERGDWDGVTTYMKGVIKKDLRLIDLSDFVIFNFEFEKPTFGTMHELVVAEQQRKPMFITCQDLKTVPLWVMGLINKKYFYPSVSHIINSIKAINSGECEIDDNRWYLLKKELR